MDRSAATTLPGDFDAAARLVAGAQRPEDLFGPDPAQAHRRYRLLARFLYPDLHPDAVGRATAAFARLADCWDQARRRIADGRYGAPEPAPVATTLRAGDGRAYVVRGVWRAGDLADLFRTDAGLVVKVARQPRDSDLLAREAASLRALAAAPGADAFRRFVPPLVDAFTIRTDDGSRAANVLEMPDGLYSLDEVLAAKGRLDARDATWIYRRLLKVLAFARRAGLVHAAVLPAHVLIHPAHGLTLVDWAYAVPIGRPPRAIPSHARDLYPASVFDRQPATPALDLRLAAATMVALLGGDPRTGRLPESVHPRLRAFFSSWWRAGADKTQDAARLLREFTTLVDGLWERQYRPFSMPDATAG